MNILIYIYFFFYQFPATKDPQRKFGQAIVKKNSGRIKGSVEPATGDTQITAPATKQHYHQGRAVGPQARRTLGSAVAKPRGRAPSASERIATIY